jgi:hypothetical protein
VILLKQPSARDGSFLFPVDQARLTGAATMAWFAARARPALVRVPNRAFLT